MLILLRASRSSQKEAREVSPGGRGESQVLARNSATTHFLNLNDQSLDLHHTKTDMAALPTMRQLSCLKSVFKIQEPMLSTMTRRSISTAYSKRPARVPLPPNLPQQFLSQIPVRMQPQNGKSDELFSTANSFVVLFTDPSQSI